MINEGQPDVCGTTPTMKYINPNPAPGSYAFTWGATDGCLANHGIFLNVFSDIFTVTLTVSVSGAVILTETRTGNFVQLFFGAPNVRLPFVQVNITPAPQDTTPPAAVSDLQIVTASTNSLALAWTAPGDDGNTGTAAGYDLRYTAAGPILTDADFNAATQVAGEPMPRPAGNTETLTVAGLAPATTYFFALKTRDEANNVSGLSNVATAGTQAELELTALSPVAQDATVTKTLAAPLKVKVTEAGAPKAGVLVHWELVGLPSGTAGQMLLEAAGFTSTATVGAREGLTNADGEAAVSLKLGNLTGVYIVSATVAGAVPLQLEATGKLFLEVSRDVDNIRPFSQIVSAVNQTNVTVQAFGVGGSTDTVANYPLAVVASPEAGSGGHDHNGDRPTGRFTGTGLTIFPSSATGRTDADGRLLAVFTSRFFGGFELLMGSSTIDSKVVVVSTKVAVRERDPAGRVFVPLPSSPALYSKDGGTPNHHGPGCTQVSGCDTPDQNHFGRLEVIQAMVAISTSWAETHPKLEINDISLSHGGAFDICGTWNVADTCADAPPPNGGHIAHRLGRGVDFQIAPGLSPSTLPLQQRVQLRLLVKEKGGGNIFIREYPGIRSHWHVDFKAF